MELRCTEGRREPFALFVGVGGMQLFTEFSQYMPHGMCLLWQPWLLILWAGSDLLIVLAYFAIPLALLQVVRRRKDLQHKGLVMLFAAFIMLCGLTHALSIVTLWVPIYPAAGAVKLATGLVSFTTAIVLFRLVPTLVAMPSRADLEEANEKLRAEIDSHKETLEKLREVQQGLEQTVAARTAEISRVNEQLTVAASEAVHRSRNLIAVVSSLARQTARGAGDADDFVEKLDGRLQALAVATSTVIHADAKTHADIGVILRKQLEPILLSYSGRITLEGPALDTGPEAAQQISLAIHELATNAQKHGALARDSGNVKLAWSTTTAEDGEPQLLLRWEEHSVGQKLSPPTDLQVGFGSKLLQSIVPRMLRGKGRMAWETTGLTYELTVPLQALGPPEDPADGRPPLESDARETGPGA